MVKNKFILTGTDNDGFRHRYSIKKTEEFKEAFAKFMEVLEFDPERIKKMFISEVEGEKGEQIITELKVADFEDCIRHYQNKKFDVDVFFGRLKIIILVRTKGRVAMVRYLEKKASWITLIEIEKIKKENKKMKKSIPLQRSN